MYTVCGDTGYPHAKDAAAMKRWLRTRMVSAFTRNLYAGNPTWVVIGTDPHEKQWILAMLAKKINPVSDTVFVFPCDSGADVFLRFFSHSGERDFSGHGTVAAYFGMESGDLFPFVEPITMLTQKTRFGIQHLELRIEKNRVVRVTVSFPYPGYEARPMDIQQIARILNMPSLDVLKFRYPAGIVNVSGISNLIVPMPSYNALLCLKPHFQSMRNLCDRLAINGIVVWCFDPFSKRNNTHIRYFSSNCGIREEPVSGTASAGLGCYLVYNDILPSQEMTRITVEQGHVMKSPGIVYVHVYTHDKRIMKVNFGGEAAVAFEGQIPVRNSTVDIPRRIVYNVRRA
jgi:trans-2,3-dihydro-3-hydroxyanthranilate isomerase